MSGLAVDAHPVVMTLGAVLVLVRGGVLACLWWQRRRSGVALAFTLGALVGSGVQCSTALHRANQCIAATLDGHDPAREAASSGKGSDPAWGHSMRRWATVTSRERCGMPFACSSR
jgi:hypothetical protein